MAVIPPASRGESQGVCNGCKQGGNPSRFYIVVVVVVVALALAGEREEEEGGRDGRGRDLGGGFSCLVRARKAQVRCKRKSERCGRCQRKSGVRVGD